MGDMTDEEVRQRAKEQLDTHNTETLEQCLVEIFRKFGGAENVEAALVLMPETDALYQFFELVTELLAERGDDEAKRAWDSIVGQRAQRFS